MRKFLLSAFVFISLLAFGQGNMITINSTVPNQLTVCGLAKTCTISVYNPSPFTLTNDTLKLYMPPGIEYQATTVTGSVPGVAESNITIPNQPTFVLPSIPTLSYLTITFSISVTCDVLPFLAGGGIVENDIRINYLANGNNTYDEHTTSSYIVRQPNLSISNFTNQSYTGAIGDSYSRCVTVTNGGFGELSQFTLTDVHGSGVQVASVSVGNWVSSGTTETITLNGTHFATIGDGDNLFENGESIIICESINIVNCISVASAFEAYWGCNSEHCQSSTTNANVVFPNLIPNLTFTPTASMNSCIGDGNASLQQLRIVNSGLGKAINVVLDIFLATGPGYNPNVGSYLDPASFQIKTGLSSSFTPITPSSTQITAQSAALLACMAPNSIGKATLNIAEINSGDTLYITFNTYSCCHNSCTNVGQSYINGWRYKGTYDNVCQSTYVITENWGRVYSQIYTDLINNSSPPTLSDGQTGTFNYLCSNYGNSYPVGPGAHWIFEFTLPSCLTYAGNLSILRSNGIHTWLPSSVSTSGNVVTAIFNGNPPWGLLQAEVKIDLTANCAACGGSGGSSSVSVKSFYVPNNTCSCKIGISCQSTAVSISCPGACAEGMLSRSFEMKRTSYGLPDNEPGGGNGLPDVGGTLDFTKIRTDRAMFGDTITSSFNGTVRTSLAHPSWQYCYAYSSITNGNRISYLNATLQIYRAGALFATCNAFTPVIVSTGTLRTFKYDLSVGALSACLPPGFQYLQNDSVVFKPVYKVTSNTGGPILTCNSTNEYYLSDIANPTLPADKYQCNTINGSCAVMGYFFNNEGRNSYSVKSCDNVIITQNYYLSIGPSSSNYAGGNLFPYEYRNWAHINTLKVIIPPGYDYISAQFNHIRTAGTVVTVTHPTPPTWQTLTPLNPNSDTLTFLVEPYFEGYGGTFPLSDDGFHGTLQVVVRPTCEVVPTVPAPINHTWTFAVTPNSFLTGLGSAPTTLSRTHDSIIYEPPFLFMQSTLPSINAPNMLASWEVSVSNLSNVSNALNTWLSGPVMSGINITEIYDLNTNAVILPVGEIYQIGTVPAGATRSFKITASFTSCLKDSVIIYSGWNCNAGYPATVQTYPCTPKSIQLTLTPLMPALVVNVTGPSGTIQLCDTVGYLAEGVNVQLGTAYQVTLKVVLPPGVAIIPGSSQMSYPISNPYVTISDPVFLGGTTWQWDISTIDSTIGSDGLKGILVPSLNTFGLTFNIVASCGYTSGSTVAFNLQGQAACGMPTGQEVALSSQLGITGATPPYLTAIKLATTYISPCADNSVMRVVVGNLGPQPFNATDSLFIQQPFGVSYVANSFVGLHNQPSPGAPVQYMLNGSQYLGWKLPQGVAAGDSTVFEFSYQGDPSVLSCAISQFEARSTSSTSVLCTQSGANCGINIATGDTSLSVFTYKAYLSLSNGSSTSVLNTPSGETVSVNLDVVNTGEAISNGANSILQFYYDSNGNGIYNTGDIFILQDTLQVNNNAVLNYTNTFNVAAGNACSIIATVRNAVNPCVCNPSQLLLTPPLTLLGNDTTVCSGSPVTLGPAAVTGYTYSWSPSAGLNNAAVSNPVLTTSNTGTLPVTTSYIVTVDRMGCTTKDTIAVTVNPLPVSNAGADIAVCPTVTLGNLGTANTAGYSYSWSPATGLNNIAISNPTVSQAAADTTTYVVTTTSLGCVTTDSVVVRINPLPTATISGTTAVCEGAPSPNITFTGAGATAPYTFTYTINNGSNQTITTSSGNSVSVAVPTSSADTLVYTLVSVQESSGTACLQNQSGSATVMVNPLPTATMYGSTSVCEGSTAPNITFAGTNATAPYTFTYTINGGTQLTVTTTSGSSVTVPAPTLVPGTYTYILLGVQDGSSTACPQAQSDTVTIIVNPSPTATISSNAATVCKDSPSPNVTFTGNSGTTPYTFTYSINSGTPQTVVTTNGNSVTVPVPTTIADTLVYSLISVQDSSATACLQTQSGTATVIVKPLPTTTVSGTTAVCKDDASPQVVFTGANGSAPYIFTYTVNNGSPQTITSDGDGNASVLVSTGTAGTYTYKVISIKEGSALACTQIQDDSVTVTVNPLPTGSLSGTTTVCKDAAPPLITFTGANGIPPYTFTYSINSGIPLTVTTVTGDTVSVVVPTSAAGALTYILSHVSDSSPSICEQNQNSSATVTIKSLPTATISGTTAVCKNATAPTITFTGAGGTAPYIFTYSIDNITQPTVTSTGNTATVSVPTAVAGSFTYSLVSVQESSAHQCSQIQAGSATITINPLPTATITGATEVCKNDASPFVTFTGANGTNPYTFTYTINGTQHTVGTSIGSNSITVPVPTGATDTLEYKLVSVQDGTTTACSQAQSDSITVIINPLPLADFNPSEVCFNTPVQFSDLSVVNSGTITSWSWAFGQEGTSILQNPVFTYNGFGNYTATLIINTDNGCKDTASKTVLVHPLPSPAFTAENVCYGDTTSFNEQSTIPNSDTLQSWSWNFGDNGTSAIQEPTHSYTAAGAYPVELTVTSTFGCKDSITHTVFVHPNPDIAFTANDTSGCEPLCVFFQDVSQIQSGMNASWLWDTGDGSPMGTTSEFQHCYGNDQVSQPTAYDVTLTVVSDSGCTSILTKTNYITIYPKPEADFIAQPITTTILNPVVTVSDSSLGATTWLWNFDDGATASVYNPPAHEYADTGHYLVSLIVTSQYGCKDTAEQLVIVEADFAFYVPNAFTPNDDGVNDNFSGKGVFIMEYEMMIFDRWGNLVYQTDDIKKPWDGKANGGNDMAQRDVYVYVIKVSDIKGNKYKYRGTVTLVR